VLLNFQTLKTKKMGYPLVQITNSTSHVARGTVHLASIFCSNDDYSVSPGDTWTEGSRGVCLVTKIDATLNVNGVDVQATPYESSGTSYSQYAVVVYGTGYAVTRVVTSADDLGVLDQPAATENQK
jgi:hypothetical protein